MSADMFDAGSSDWFEDEIQYVRAASEQFLEKRRREQRAALQKQALSTDVKPALMKSLHHATRHLKSWLLKARRWDRPSRILDDLLAAVRKIGITRIRYYRYSKEDDSYILVESCGYDDISAARLRVGGLVKYRGVAPLATADSFWCQALGIPVLISVDANAPAELEPDFYPGSIPLLKTPIDHCVGMIGKEARSCWLDIPLKVGKEPTGKLSCDFANPLTLLPSLLHPIVTFWARAQQAAPFLETLYRRQFILPLDNIVSALQALTSTAALFRYCVEELPKIIGCSHASVFSLSTDSFCSAKLVLERSSFSGAQASERKVCYELSDDALTAWVARNNVAIRLHDIENDTERERQLQSYRVFDIHLNWRNRQPDSDKHDSYLAVPIPGDLNQVVGVIRFTQKLSSGVRYFTERDQAFMQRVVKLAIGPRLLALRHADVAGAVSFDHVQDAGSLMVTKTVPTANDIGEAVKQMMSKFFPECGAGKKLFLMNVLENNGVTFQSHAIGGTLRNDLEHGKVYDSSGSLTGYVVHEFLRPSRGHALPQRVTFINDMPNACRRRAMMKVCGEAQTALACPIAFRKKIYGALIVKSDVHDLRPEVHGKLLELASAQVGTMFARRDHELLFRLKEQVKQLKDSKQMKDWLVQVDESLRSTGTPIQRTQRLNLRDEVAAVAKTSGCGRTIVEVPDVEVRACKPSLVGVMYSVLSDVCRRNQSEQQLAIRGQVVDNWLELTISQIFRTADPFDGELDDFEGDEVDEMLSILDRTGTEGRQLSTVTLSRMLARNYQTVDRRGSLVPSPSKLVLRIPVD